MACGVEDMNPSIFTVFSMTDKELRYVLISIVNAMCSSEFPEYQSEKVWDILEKAKLV